jgi:hypothetical protein
MPPILLLVTLNIAEDAPVPTEIGRKKGAVETAENTNVMLPVADCEPKVLLEIFEFPFITEINPLAVEVLAVVNAKFWIVLPEIVL